MDTDVVIDVLLEHEKDDSELNLFYNHLNEFFETRYKDKSMNTSNDILKLEYDIESLYKEIKKNINRKNDEVEYARKYKLVNEKEIKLKNGRLIKLYQIQSILPHSSKSNILGGWVESEYNLSQFGSCWINSPTSVVYGDAKVTGSTFVGKNVEIGGNSYILNGVIDSNSNDIIIDGNTIINDPNAKINSNSDFMTINYPYRDIFNSITIYKVNNKIKLSWMDLNNRELSQMSLLDFNKFIMSNKYSNRLNNSEKLLQQIISNSVKMIRMHK